MILTEAPLPIEKFDKARHNRDELTSGFRPIDNFLKKSLSEQIAGGLLAAYVAAVEGRVNGPRTAFRSSTSRVAESKAPPPSSESLLPP